MTIGVHTLNSGGRRPAAGPLALDDYELVPVADIDGNATGYWSERQLEVRSVVTDPHGKEGGVPDILDPDIGSPEGVCPGIQVGPDGI